MQQKKEKVRIFALARELNMETKDLLVLCQQNGLDVKNQLSTIEPEVRDQIVQLIKKGGSKPAAPAAPSAPAATAPVVPTPTRRIVNLDSKARATPKAESPSAPAAPAVEATPEGSADVVAPAEKEPARPAATAKPEAPVPPAVTKPTTPAVPAAVKPVSPPPGPSVPPHAETSAPVAPVVSGPDKGGSSAAAVPPGSPAAPTAPPRPPEGTRPPMRPMNRPLRNLGGSPPRQAPTVTGGGSAGTGPRIPPRVGGSGPQRPPLPGGFRVTTSGGPTPSSVRPVKPTEPPKAPPSTGPKKLADINAETLAGLEGRGGNISVREIEERIRKQQQVTGGQVPGLPGAAVPPGGPEIEDDDDSPRGKAKRGGGAPAGGGPSTGVAGRADRHKERSERQARRKTQDEGRGGKIAVMDDDQPRWRKDHRRRIAKQPGTVDRIGKIPLTLPITVRSLSEALGRKAGEVLFTLLGHGMPPTTNINSSIDAEVAELVALEFGKEVEIKKETDVEKDLIASHELADNPEELVYRAPVVAVMGHVDHGKTSLLDRIREQYGIRSDVVSTEAGGITQVIRAWRVEKDGKPITFLDTPGHEAFTKMRARGANVTDVAVIVVAANDGVMPQTEEAISHAKAAEVSIVVAINKVDLPDANLRKTEQMLMSLGLIPDTMGGDVPFVQTSAKTGKGIDELLEQLSVVAELNELQANPNKPASGTCLEAHLSEKEGVQATLLVQNGTLRPGDVVLCGATYGSVRKMYDDLGRVINEAGPSVPVRILGLDEVPNADDSFHVVPNLATAQEIGEERKARQRQKSLVSRAPVTLENLKDAHIAELKVILKADARGSIEAIRNEIGKLHHEEVRIRLLHTGIGAISVSDVQLALTSPEDTLIIGFNAVPDTDARILADERGVQLREYDIIYKLAEDLRAALEGKLKPREEVVHLGRANVRETFKISRVGTIAGCFVTQGIMDRSAKIRVIRGGVVVYPPADRTAGLESLKRFKDDVREVREGFECGIKIAGYDDIKVGDSIECYKIEQIQRTLN